MKKSLLAVAAIGAFASAAQAQSSVTVYGILDVGLYGGTQQGTTVPTTSAGATRTASNGLQFGESAEQTSRLGFKCTEDLGGGRQAIFTAEFTLYPSDPVLSGTTGNGLANRQTFLGLHQNGVGAATIGTQYTGIFDEAAVTDPGQLNNVAGGIIYAVGGVASAVNGQAVNGVDGISGQNVGFTTRTSNTLKLQSDAFSGFRVNASYVMNDSNTYQATTTATTTGGIQNTNGWGLGADYTWNKLYVTAQYQAFKNNTVATGTVNPAGYVLAGTGQLSLTATQTNQAVAVAVSTLDPLNIQDKQAYAAATYDFGILKAYAQYVNRQVQNNNDTNYNYKRSAEQIGVRSFVTPTIETWAMAGLGRVTAYGSSNPTANFNGWQLGSNYWSSKRTNLYAIYGAVNQSTAALTPAANPAGVTTNQNAQQYAVGIRHTF